MSRLRLFTWAAEMDSYSLMSSVLKLSVRESSDSLIKKFFDRLI
jgi:hypothetical protein